MESIKNKLGTLNIDFVGKRRIFATFSIILVIMSWVGFFVVDVNWGIDFTGGTELQFRFPDKEDSVTIQEVREALVQLEIGEDAIQGVGKPEDQEYLIRIKDPEYGSGEMQEEVRRLLDAHYSKDWVQEIMVSAEVGVRMAITYSGDPVAPKEVQQVLSTMPSVTAEMSKEDNQVIVKLPGLDQIIRGKLRSQLQGKELEIVQAVTVGPKVGGDLKQAGFLSIAITLVLVLIYVAFRFDIAFSPGAVLALFHDVSITIGVFVLSNLWGNGLEVNLAIIGALLTIVGYSLNDTIVIYDRIRENTDRYRRKNIPDLINVSINETMARTLATSVTTFLALLPFLFMGGNTIQTFAFAMLLGVIVGTYSTIYVASPMILVMQDVKPILMKMIVIPGGNKSETSDSDEPESEGGALTKTEQRRRDRTRGQEKG
jgi:preprotein translocase subunit SecF